MESKEFKEIVKNCDLLEADEVVSCIKKIVDEDCDSKLKLYWIHELNDINLNRYFHSVKRDLKKSGKRKFRIKALFEEIAQMKEEMKVLAREKKELKEKFYGKNKTNGKKVVIVKRKSIDN